MLPDLVNLKKCNILPSLYCWLRNPCNGSTIWIALPWEPTTIFEPSVVHRIQFICPWNRTGRVDVLLKSYFFSIKAYMCSKDFTVTSIVEIYTWVVTSTTKYMCVLWRLESSHEKKHTFGEKETARTKSLCDRKKKTFSSSKDVNFFWELIFRNE